MLFQKSNLLNELLYHRSKSTTEENLLKDVQFILDENQKKRDLIKQNLLNKNAVNSNAFNFDLLEANKIFHVNQIKDVCVSYRLRFLDSFLFKNEIPEEAISIINSLEKTHKTILDGFKIIAPSKAFKLINYDDPLLFAPIGNDYYYLIHKWGNDFSWYRKLLVLPFKNVMNFLVFTLLISLLATMVIPMDKLTKMDKFAPIIVFLFMFKSIVAVGAYNFFAMGKNFNNEIWNRKFKEN